MKLEKSTKILINLVLILMAALLLKHLIIIPEELHAQRARGMYSIYSYKVSGVEEEFDNLIKEMGKKKLGTSWWEKMTANEQWTYMFNWNARKGWRLHDFIAFDEEILLIFESLTEQDVGS